MYKLRRVYICDICDKVSLPGEYSSVFGDVIKSVPRKWQIVGKMHFCPVCYETWCSVILREKKARQYDD